MAPESLGRIAVEILSALVRVAFLNLHALSHINSIEGLVFPTKLIK
ncbi:hypothetical protein MCEWOLH11_00882 [Candidatus Methylopumilus universalis]